MKAFFAEVLVAIKEGPALFFCSDNGSYQHRADTLQATGSYPQPDKVIPARGRAASTG